ncbi:endonuclease/exonuclease/phosphatase family protein [Candidatus Entotheonella palauensis]|uniref:endonuclease/exonuclease/phosphatase family protein n=1 Tax=Candidatus Entotheonella palauensis TaxID=93172 RepID=UPI000B7C5872|nr:endonuclease/exonuclease/phosphatase family protein [Candidatus Entotheonella palauensis]
MMVFIALAILLVLLLGACLWAAGGYSVYTTPGSGIIEAIPNALEADPAPPEGQLVLLSYALDYAWQPLLPGSPPSDAAAICDRLDGVIETIAASGADIALLQEVDFASARTCDIDQLYYMAAALGWGYVARAVTWECRYLPWPWRQPAGRIRAGLGVMSRYPLTQHVRHHLPQARAGWLWAARFFPRHAVQMVDVHCGATTLRLLNTHVDTRRTSVQQRQMRRLAAFVHGVRTPFCILMGRLRGAAQDDTLAALTTEPPNPLHAVTAPIDPQALQVADTQPDSALIGRSLQALEARLIEVETPISEDLPLALHLRWNLPLMPVLG